jgi:hypothetical protein
MINFWTTGELCLQELSICNRKTNLMMYWGHPQQMSLNWFTSLEMLWSRMTKFDECFQTLLLFLLMENCGCWNVSGTNMKLFDNQQLNMVGYPSFLLMQRETSVIPNICRCWRKLHKKSDVNNDMLMFSGNENCCRIPPTAVADAECVYCNKQTKIVQQTV